jgi:release factor glutamine methyltransferase
MTVFAWLKASMVKLRDAGVDSPRRDCMVLLEDLLNKDRSWVNAHGEHKLTDKQITTLDQQIKKRLNRIPLAYIRGKAWFYKRFFTVNPDVLIPRPESESFIEILRIIEINSPRIADIGTGSGALGITAALELSDASVDLYDISDEALAVAAMNVKKYDLALSCFKSDLLQNLKENYDILLANLPYVPESLVTSPEIETEPQIALFSGEDGLDHYRKFWQQVKNLSLKPQYILTEALENQHLSLSRMAEESGYRVCKTDVLVQQFRLEP